MSLPHEAPDYENFSVAIDDDGIALITWDMPGRSMNVLSESSIRELDAIINAITVRDDITGAVVASGKDTFCAGADLTMLEALTGAYHSAVAAGGDLRDAKHQVFAKSRALSLSLRRLETCGKPVAAALSGTALGGGWELALACHARFAAQNDKAGFGLPEVKVGLMPGGGGTQRIARMLKPEEALRMLLQGTRLPAQKARAAGLLNDVVPADALIATARQWVRENPKAVAPWDRRGFRLPGGRVYSAGGMMVFPAANALYRKTTYDNYPGARSILSAVYEGLQLPMDLGLQVESRYFAHVLTTREASAMIRSLFISMQDLGKGARRPQAVAPNTIRRVGIVGAGFMGAGIAYVTVAADMNVVLLDRDPETAEKGKALCDKLISERVARGRARAADREALLARVHASADYADLKDCDLVIEAVFEDAQIKAQVIGQVEAVIPEACIFASNTSTLPITELARNSARADQFVGIHFFSPVHKMMLVEIIRGRKTGDKALAMALDYVRAIRKTPIVVNDSRGFYTSRVVGTYIGEGHELLCEGVPPAFIENAARMAGMPVGPLSLNDEVALDLTLKIMNATKAALGARYQPGAGDAIIAEMVTRRGRLGRKNGKGFYDYPDKGKKRLWPGLHQLEGVGARRDVDIADVEDVKLRLLVRQALETARCFEEGVLSDVREADVGSILGFGFAPYTGGALSYIDGMGVDNFVRLCRRFARQHGPRFKPCKLLNQMAGNGETFYSRFPPPQVMARDSAA